VKTVLTPGVVVSAAGITNGWVQRAAEAADESGGPAAWLVVTGSAGHLLLLAAATLISVDKPWGRTWKEQR
jgi:galactokinase/mevalonate kinase-like predicted kinase